MCDTSTVHAAPSEDLLTPDNSVMLFVDHQPQMFFGTGSGDRAAIINSTVGLAKTARAFDVPVVLTTVAAESFSGPLTPWKHRLPVAVGDAGSPPTRDTAR